MAERRSGLAGRFVESSEIEMSVGKVWIEFERPFVGADRIVIEAKVFIDTSYEGDLMARAGVSYTVGREPNSQYGETYNGVQLSRLAGVVTENNVTTTPEFPLGVDPYGDSGRDTGDTTRLASFDVGRIQPHERPITFQRPLEECVHTLVNLATQP